MTDKEPVTGVDPIDLSVFARSTDKYGPVWGLQTEDLNLNLMVLGPDGTVAAHINSEVDVLLVGIEGQGVVEVQGRTHSLASGQALVIPKGESRSIRSDSERFAYLTCHRRRAGLWPQGIPRR